MVNQLSELLVRVATKDVFANIIRALFRKLIEERLQYKDRLIPFMLRQILC